MKLRQIREFFSEQDGATAVEYGIMVAAIAAVIITIVISVGTKTNSAFDKIDNSMVDLVAS